MQKINKKTSYKDYEILGFSDNLHFYLIKILYAP
jgi:hypothetical protein